ncbi:MAG: RIP metalloprotease RseP [Candidatus Magasanikbacteria bacterium CG11_big_fil_rev_8_21_14_0_20_39_34]|uniref:Zinc metalloprotease n=1 Tax=Candidatus Magasanikbacteria bacterium CG11_big_fil_rev_8_21_14_0_20_39_34 TaxID=1974653 RepID=A0A2H0N4M1_9BACT|nr:MAG: RIP metalloprotease RseP [Candidatus Magasanikbacteria bacterium CG11_big_fil_rev_8_21_14_0_20_39_34]
MGTLVVFIIVLGILVFVHEFGHFLAARKSGMKVYEFALGFPPLLIGFYKDPKSGKIVWVKRGSKSKDKLAKVGGGEAFEEEYPATLYSLNLLPLGGYCKIKGENGELESEPDSFGYQKTWKKLVVLVAGVTMNFIFAAVVLGIGFMIGLPMDISDGIPKGAELVGEQHVVIQQVEKDSAAEHAGLKMGDKILSMDGTEASSIKNVIEYVNTKGEQDIDLVYNRAGEVKKLTVKPQIVGETTEPHLGVYLADAAMVRFPWYISVYKGFWAAALGFINILIGFFFLLKGIITGQGLLFDVSGPVGIAVLVGESAKLGINYLLNITAMISLSLAVINILPIPALDGGRALFVVIEKVSGRPVPMKYEQLAHTIGFVLLMILIVVVSARDIIGLF